MSRQAFTLIELLVVIAIIAILAAILFPVFAQAKAAAKKTQCLSNEKQIGIGLYLYVGDSDDTLPMANYPGSQGPPYTQFSWQAGKGVAELNWADLLLPYTKNIDIFHCPMDGTGLASNPVGSANKVPGAPLSMALNAYFYRLPGGITNYAITGGSMSEITASASKIFIAESASAGSTELMRPDRWQAPDGSSTFERHGGGANWVYADTHAHYHKMPQWWKTVPASVWKTPETAQQEPCPQWFPWLDDTSEKW